MPVRRPNGRNVKSNVAPDANGAADGHERAKDFLSEGEFAVLLDAAKAGRHGVRDHLLLLVMFRHGLRVSEAVAVRRDEVDLDRARLWVRRLKGGLSVEQPIAGDHFRAGPAAHPPISELSRCCRRTVNEKNDIIPDTVNLLGRNR
jgi:type 1 fimbriae regulatory protein FimB